MQSGSSRRTSRNPRHRPEMMTLSSPLSCSLTRRRFLKYGLGGLACLGGGVAAAYCVKRWADSVADTVAAARTATDVFKNDAPRGRLWDQWQARGWERRALHLDLDCSCLCQW